MLNLDFERFVGVRLEDEPWRPSPMPGVERRLLEREEAESGRATSVVRYAPGAAFPQHTHTGGEEFLVLAGVFSDENGDFPAGTYVRNPIGSKHAPSSAVACTIFVKLFQMTNRQETQTVIHSTRPFGADRDQRERTLFEDPHETVRMLRPNPHAHLSLEGTEILVVEGSVAIEEERYPALSWLRIPRGDERRLTSSPGTLLWTKTRHLPDAGDECRP